MTVAAAAVGVGEAESPRLDARVATGAIVADQIRTAEVNLHSADLTDGDRSIEVAPAPVG